MINTYERQEDILKLISQLDITDTMYKNADEKYHAIARFLVDCGIEADIYPQGSFAFGTVLKPSSKTSDASYDLDFICQLHLSRNEISPSELQRNIREALESSNRYGGKLTVFEECFTVEYADINGVSFTIDIVPATDESLEKKADLSRRASRPDLINTAISIPRHNGERNYSWLTNNPKGFKAWFDEINQPFLDFRKAEIRKSIYENHRMVYNSIEDVPAYMERSSVQRVIQILKYHRNVYYSIRKNGNELSPISAIINTLVADISRSASPTLDVFQLLAYVLNELQIYAEHLQIRYDYFEKKYGARVSITHTDGRWVIQNPANPDDNLADKWNENSEIPKTFFEWINICHTDLITALNLPDTEFRTHMDNAFGAEAIEKSWGGKYRPVAPKPIITAKAAQPYRFK